MLRRTLISTLLVIGGWACAAESAEMLSGEKLRKAVSGKTVYLKTPIGAEVPIRYRANGMLHGKTSPGLAALGGESVSADTGRWWIAREKLCQQWRNWADRRSYCYEFRVAGDTVQWQRSDGASGSARISAN